MTEDSDRGIHRLRATAAMQQIEAMQGVDVWIIDNVSDAYDANENERRLVRAFIRRLGGLVRSNGGAVLMLQHLPKDAAKRGGGTESYSGSTAWHNSVRSRLVLTQERGGLVKLTQEKSNLGRCISPLYFERDDEGVMLPVSAPARKWEDIAPVDEDVLQAIADAAQSGRAVGTATAGALPSARVIQEMLRISAARVPPPKEINAALIRLEQGGRIVRQTVNTAQRKTREVWAAAPNAPNAPNEELGALSPLVHSACAECAE